VPHAVVDELDLELLNALQITPRASWSQLGRALDVDPVTAARRWQRLHAAGTAWVTCVVGPPEHSSFCLAYIDVRAEPGRLDDCAQWLAARPETLYVHHLTGTWQLLAVVTQPSPSDAAAYLRHTMGDVPGLRDYRAEIRTRGYSEPSRWRLRSLEPAQRQALQPASPATGAHRALGDRGPSHPLDGPLYELLHEDGRMPLADLAAHSGAGEATVRRRVKHLLDSGTLRLRCEVAQSVTGWPVSAVLRCSVPPADLDLTARTLAALPDTRLCCSLTGERNVLLMAWLRTLDDLPALEARVTGRCPGLTVRDRAVCLHTPKQMGRLLDGDGRAVAYLGSSGRFAAAVARNGRPRRSGASGPTQA
jgi:DNA-binding Lrp family transcriptional regulator